MKGDPRAIPFRLWLLGLLIACHVVSAINPANMQDFIFEHIPTAACVIGLIIYDRTSKHGPLSNLSYALIFVFLILHIIGAHYLYTNVPYDDWSQAVFGRSISDFFGWERNHYDRLVHFLYGVVMLKPIHEIISRYARGARFERLLLAVLILAFSGTVYEWIEWIFSIVLSPEAAENYNGQQGDMFDAHKDMLLALVGSLISAVIVWMTSARD